MSKCKMRVVCLVVFFALFLTAFGYYPSVAYAQQGHLLRLGSRGTEVKNMQQALIDLGFLSGRADGIFGPITQSAVMAFQRANGLAVDGIAGPRTLGALYGSAPSSGDGSSGGQSSRGSTISRTLRLGDRGEDVATLQRRLNELNFNCGRADGVFGPITQSAVMAFQRANGLAVDGIAGPRTLGALYGSAPSSGDSSSGGQSSRGSTISRTLRLGDRGEDVATLQRRLNELNFNCGRADGVFGPMTQAAVMAFQRANGLAVDGIVGRNTIAKLYASDVITGDLPHTSKAEDIIAFAMGYIGKPYVYGASGPNSFDCSGFTSFVFKHFGVNLKRSAWDQGNDNRFAVLAQQELQKGDIVFFDTSTSTNTRYHVGIYISNGEFIHASSGGGSVRVDTLASGYYQQTFKWGLRILK